MAILQVNNSFIAGVIKFRELRIESSLFETKTVCINKHYIVQWSCNILIGDREYSVTQQKKKNGLTVPSTEKGLKNQRSLVKYIGVNCTTSVCSAVKLIVSGYNIITK